MDGFHTRFVATRISNMLAIGVDHKKFLFVAKRISNMLAIGVDHKKCMENVDSCLVKLSNHSDGHKSSSSIDTLLRDNFRISFDKKYANPKGMGTESFLWGGTI